MEIEIRLNPYRAPALDVRIEEADGTERLYTLEPLDFDKAGFRKDAPVIGQKMRAMPDTVTDKAVKAIQKEAYGAGTLEEAQKAREANARAYADLDPMADVKKARIPTYMPKRGRDLGLVASSRELAPLNHVDAAFELRRVLARQGLEWDAECLQWLKRRYPESVPADSLEAIGAELAASMLKPEVEERPALRLIVNGGAA